MVKGAMKTRSPSFWKLHSYIAASIELSRCSQVVVWVNYATCDDAVCTVVSGGNEGEGSMP